MMSELPQASAGVLPPYRLLQCSNLFLDSVDRRGGQPAASRWKFEGVMHRHGISKMFESPWDGGNFRLKFPRGVVQTTYPFGGASG